MEPEMMRLALAQARKSRPSPNPRVGAVVVDGGEVVGLGHHVRPGAPHAEIVALTEAGARARGADLYVTLEPCCHEGRTGPCTEAIHRAGIGRVVIGMIDPDPRVSGKGMERLVESGHEVEVGVLREECEELLASYTMHRTLGRPLVTLKAAVTLDGSIATEGGVSKWITGTEARERAHALRAECDAVLVGVETVLADDPMLTVRSCPGESPLRVVMDSRLRTPTDSKLVETATEVPLVLAHAGAPDATRWAGLPGVETLECRPTTEGRVDPVDLLGKLAERGVLSLLVEGGGMVHGAFVREGLADCVALFAAPILFGAGKPWVSFEGAVSPDRAVRLEGLRVTPVGEDLMLRARFSGPAATRRR